VSTIEREAAARGARVAYRMDDNGARRVRDFAWLVVRHPLRVLRDVRDQRRWRREEPVPPLRELAPVARRIARFHAEHLHAHFAAGASLDALRVGALLGRPYSVMTHGYDIFSLPRNLREKHERAAFAVTACEYSARYLREALGSDRVQRLVMGANTEFFARRGSHPGGRTVIAVGRLVEKKGFEVLIEAAALVDSVRVMIVGRGPLEERLHSRARALGVEERVEFVGSRTPAEVRDLLEQSDVLAAPSVVAANGDRDTMPVVVKEALAMEVPVVASEAVGLPEIVRPEWGRLVPPGDPRALAGAIQELLSLPVDERAEMGRAGREFVIEHCDVRRETARLAEMIAGARPGRLQQR
jgi:glycosyltransferase involved in cell wall biosynthesis